jgi:hypothetical protein
METARDDNRHAFAVDCSCEVCRGIYNTVAADRQMKATMRELEVFTNRTLAELRATWEPRLLTTAQLDRVETLADEVLDEMLVRLYAGASRQRNQQSLDDWLEEQVVLRDELHDTTLDGILDYAVKPQVR